MAHFDDLPTEILSWIMSLLYQIHESNDSAIQNLIPYNLVSKRFYGIISPIVWRSAAIDRGDLPSDFLTILMATTLPSPVGQHIRHLTYTHPSSGGFLSFMLAYIDQLTCLELSEAGNIDDNSIQLMLRHLGNLTSLTLENANITERSIKLVVEHCQQLTTLKLHNCPRLTSAVLSALAGDGAAAASSLQHLDINVDPTITTNWIPTDTTTATSTSNNALFSLHRFNTYKYITRRIMNNINSNSDFINETNNNAHGSSSSSSSSSSSNSNMIETNLVMDALRLTRLTEFKLVGAPTRFVRRLLSTLATSNGDDDDDRGWPCLVSLTLSDEDRTIDEDDLISFIQLRPELTTLSLIGANITDTMLATIAHFLPDIQTIQIMDSKGITARGVRRLARQCPRITRIHIARCRLSYRDFPEAYSSNRREITLDQQAIEDIQQAYSSDPEQQSKYKRRRRWFHFNYSSDNSSDGDDGHWRDVRVPRVVFYDVDDFDHYQQGNSSPWHDKAFYSNTR